jgi:CheY-like chemotaxis protein
MKTKSYNILVVDDDWGVLMMTAMALEMMGYRTTPALGGVAAVEAMNRSCYDAILTDLNMPGMDGTVVLREARERHPDAPVIIMTGNPTQARACSDTGNAPDVVLEKPFRLEELLSSLEGCLCPS